MDEILVLAFCILSAVAGWLLGMTVAAEAVAVRDAIAECESTLPRDKTCKYVITAEVAE